MKHNIFLAFASFGAFSLLRYLWLIMKAVYSSTRKYLRFKQGFHDSTLYPLDVTFSGLEIEDIQSISCKCEYRVPTPEELYVLNDYYQYNKTLYAKTDDKDSIVYQVHLGKEPTEPSLLLVKEVFDI